MTETTVNRRTLVQGAVLGGAAVVTVGALAACGSSDDGTTTGAGAAASGGGGTASGGTASGVTVAESDVPVGGGTVLNAAEVVVTQPSEGEFKAFSAVCTHWGCLVGSVKDGQIVCPCHGSTFDASSGAVTGGPATSPLSAKTVTVSGSDLVIS